MLNAARDGHHLLHLNPVTCVHTCPLVLEYLISLTTSSLSAALPLDEYSKIRNTVFRHEQHVQPVETKLNTEMHPPSLNQYVPPGKVTHQMARYSIPPRRDTPHRDLYLLRTCVRSSTLGLSLFIRTETIDGGWTGRLTVAH